MLESFQVPKDQATVVMELPPDVPARVVIFLSPFAEHHRGQETVSDLFRNSSPFLPVRNAEGKSVLVRKKAVRAMKILEPERVEWLYFEMRDGAPRYRISVSFYDGLDMEGYIVATTPVGHQRVSDVVNLTGPFIHIEAEDGVYLLNLAHVGTIRIVEEAHGDAG